MLVITLLVILLFVGDMMKTPKMLEIEKRNITPGRICIYKTGPVSYGSREKGRLQQLTLHPSQGKPLAQRLNPFCSRDTYNPFTGETNA